MVPFASISSWAAANPKFAHVYEGGKAAAASRRPQVGLSSEALILILYDESEISDCWDDDLRDLIG